MTNLTPYDRHQNILTLVRTRDVLDLKLGEELYYFYEAEGYLDRGHASFAAYLADPEVNLGFNEGYALKRIYKRLVLDLGLLPAVMPSWTKLEAICPHITEENKDELLNDADTLSRSDLRKLMREKFGKPKELKDLFMEGIKEITRIIYDIEHMASEGQYKRLYDIKKLLKEM